MANDKGIRGTVRLGGKTFGEGDEEALEALGKELGVPTERAFGVDSTEQRGGRNKEKGGKLRARVLARNAEREAAAGELSAEKVEEILGTSVADLETALADVSDVAALKRLSRRDKRVSAKPLYDARLEALKAESASE